MLARIYKPARTAMQSGNAAATRWVLEYEPEIRPAADPLMGYTSQADMRRQLRLEFATREEAVAYAERNRIPYRLAEEQVAARKKISYADNFRFGRPSPWTH
ncbi:ETC complex I subunit [soil metagenome]